jgi:hypothetical protein
MKSSYTDYLQNLEVLAANCRREDFYLWPRTPMGRDHQDQIVERVGVSDYDVTNRSSRPAMIIRQIQHLIRHGFIGDEFSLLDITCGDAIVLWQIKKAFPHAQCYGVDCNKGKFEPHEIAQREGVGLFRGYIQHLFVTDPPTPFDVALMLNTYRGWESADLREHERDLPRLADAWFDKNARYTIVTATERQIRHHRQSAHAVSRLGKGEDNSTMVCLSRTRLRRSPWRFFPWRHRTSFG